MEEGINLNDQSQPITIDPNVRRKKSGLMVGKRTGQNTLRPTILDYGQTGDEGSRGRRVSEEAITNVIHIHHSRSFSDEIVTSTSVYFVVCVYPCVCVCACLCVLCIRMCV